MGDEGVWVGEWMGVEEKELMDDMGEVGRGG